MFEPDLMTIHPKVVLTFPPKAQMTSFMVATVALLEEDHKSHSDTSSGNSEYKTFRDNPFIGGLTNRPTSPSTKPPNPKIV